MSIAYKPHSWEMSEHHVMKADEETIRHFPYNYDYMYAQLDNMVRVPVAD